MKSDPSAVSVDATLAAFAEPAGESKLAPHRGTIDRLFRADRVEDTLALRAQVRGPELEEHLVRHDVDDHQLAGADDLVVNEFADREVEHSQTEG